MASESTDSVTTSASGTGRGFVRGPDDGWAIELPGWRYTVKVAASDTGGRLTVLEGTMAPGHQGPLEHLHSAHDEAFTVLEGTLRFRIGNEYRDIEVGETVFVSRGLAHGFSNPDYTPVRFLVMLTPSGYETYFERLAGLIKTSGSMPSRDALLKLMAEHGSFAVDADGAIIPR